MKIDLSRLQNTRTKPGLVEARCPACATYGADRKGNNLAVFETGAFHCHANPHDRDHNREILRLVGDRTEGPPSTYNDHRTKVLATARMFDDRRVKALGSCITENRNRIIDRYSWDIDEVRLNSPQPVALPEISQNPSHFLATHFASDSLLWTGDVYDSGKPSHRSRWRTRDQWLNSPSSDTGPYTTAAIWKPGIFSRSSMNVLQAPYAILDFDGFDGHAPKTAFEIDCFIHDALAIIRMFRDVLFWELTSIVWTGNKGLHAWFIRPPLHVIKSVCKIAPALGIDRKVLGSPEQPCRLPGHAHHKSHNVAEVWWMA